MMIMTNKVTLKEQIEAIAFENLTEEDFSFLKERALKSIRTSNGKKTETKVQKMNKALTEDILAFIAEKGDKVLIKEIEDAFGISNQKASILLNKAVDAGRLVKTEAKGKQKATFSLAE